MSWPGTGQRGADAVEYVLAASVEEALHLLARWAGEARILAGGTDVLPDMRRTRIHPRCLVDITRIPELDQIRVVGDWLEVGAAVTLAAIKDSPLIAGHVHALADAARAMGALAIQNAATWVGNLVQAMPAADGAIVALALDAEARIVDAGRAGEYAGRPQWFPVESLFQGPGISAVHPTRQFVTHLRFPYRRGRWGTGWKRIGRRPSLVLPILNCAVSLELDGEGQRIEKARIALGPVAPRPYRAQGVERFLLRQPATPEILAQAAQLAREEANPRDSRARASRAYRLAVIPAMVEDALISARERAMDSRPPLKT